MTDAGDALLRLGLPVAMSGRDGVMDESAYWDHARRTGEIFRHRFAEVLCGDTPLARAFAAEGAPELQGLILRCIAECAGEEARRLDRGNSGRGLLRLA